MTKTRRSIPAKAASLLLLAGGYNKCCVVHAFQSSSSSSSSSVHNLQNHNHHGSSSTTTPSSSSSSSSSSLSMATIANDKFDLDKLENGVTELHRRDRRDFFDHTAWVQHRGSQRFFDNLSAIPFSKVVWTVTAEALAVTAIAAFTVFWNHGLVIGYEDLAGVYHPPLLASISNVKLPLLVLPSEPFVLSSPALSLLLVFRTDTCWRRWDEARKAWGVIVNNSRTIARKTNSWIIESDMPYDDKQRLLTRIADSIWAFARAERRHLLSEFEDEQDFITDVNNNLQEPFASDLIKNKRHRPSYALFEMTCAINELPLDMFRRNHIDESVSQLCNAMGTCDRIYGSPIPKSYNRHTSRFLSLWLALMPLMLWSSMGSSWNHIYLIIVSSIVALGMLGIEQIALMIEEPFSILPLKQIADGIGKSASEHVEFNIIEEFGTASATATKTKTDQILRNYMQDNYNTPEYLEALSTETIIRYEDLAQPVVSTVYTPPVPSLGSADPAAPIPLPQAPPVSIPFPQQPKQYSTVEPTTLQQQQYQQQPEQYQQPQQYSYVVPPPPEQQQSFAVQPQQQASSDETASQWDYLAQASAAMDEKMDDYDRIANMQRDVLRDIQNDLKQFGGAAEESL